MVISNLFTKYYVKRSVMSTTAFGNQLYPARILTLKIISMQNSNILLIQNGTPFCCLVYSVLFELFPLNLSIYCWFKSYLCPQRSFQLHQDNNQLEMGQLDCFSEMDCNSINSSMAHSGQSLNSQQDHLVQSMSTWCEELVWKKFCLVYTSFLGNPFKNEQLFTCCHSCLVHIHPPVCWPGFP